MDSTWDSAPLLNRSRRDADRERLVLVLSWSREEPARVGEVLVPGEGPGLLGRADTPAPDAARLGLVRLRPGAPQTPLPLGSRRVSRDQLRITPVGDAALRIENLGRCRLLVRGRPVDLAELQPGQSFEIEDEVVFLVVRRVPRPPDHRGRPPRFAFGEPDDDGMVGESAAMWAIRAQVDAVGPRPVHVLVRGESGTGKELVSAALHRRSSRGKAAMIARNAATIPASLVDAELFGNARNYPNPGMAERVGLVGEADGSTLFLDEFAELPLDAQAHLLRVLDQGEYHRLGESRARRADIRLVAATNRPESAIKHDVLARMPLRIELPSLRDRRDDVPLVARSVLRRMAARDPEVGRRFLDEAGQPRFSPALIAGLLAWPWTTNVRELEQILWRSVGISAASLLDWPDDLDAPGPARHAAPESPAEPGESAEAGTWTPEQIQEMLDAFDGRQEPTWRALGMSSRHVLTRLVRRHGLRVRGRAGDDDGFSSR